MEQTQTTEIALTASIGKKQRSEAQINATKRALEALQAKRKDNWEKKKEDLASTFLEKGIAHPSGVGTIPKEHFTSKASLSAGEPKEEPKESPPLKETIQKIIKKHVTVTDSSEVPEWAKAMYEKIEKLSNKRDKEHTIDKKQKKRVIIEESESESSDEEIIIKKKKKTPISAPTVVTPTISPPNENPLRKLLNRR